MNNKQYALLVWLVASVVGAVAASCGSCEFLDTLVGMCSPCSLICPLELKRCKRLCSDWPECVLSTTPTPLPSTMTPLTSTTPVTPGSSHWPWIVGLVVAFVLITVVVGVSVWCKPCHRGCRLPLWRKHKDEVRSPQECPLMLQGDATRPPQGDAAGPSQGDATGPSHGCTAACSKPKGVPPVCCPNKGPSSDHQFVPSGSTKNRA